MDSQQFRTLRVAAGLSVRAAARRLSVAPSTVQRWEDGARIPSEAATKIRELAGDLNDELAAAKALGRLSAVLAHIRFGYTPQEAHNIGVNPGTRSGIGELLMGLQQEKPGEYAELEPEIADILSGLEDYPTHMDAPQTAQFWLGYYSRRKDFEEQADAATKLQLAIQSIRAEVEVAEKVIRGLPIDDAHEAVRQAGPAIDDAMRGLTALRKGGVL